MSKPQETGYIYVLSNKSSFWNIEDRNDSRFHTRRHSYLQLLISVPSPFVVEYATKVDNCY